MDHSLVHLFAKTDMKSTQVFISVWVNSTLVYVICKRGGGGGGGNRDLGGNCRIFIFVLFKIKTDVE